MVKQKRATHLFDDAPVPGAGGEFRRVAKAANHFHPAVRTSWVHQFICRGAKVVVDRKDLLTVAECFPPPPPPRSPTNRGWGPVSPR